MRRRARRGKGLAGLERSIPCVLRTLGAVRGTFLLVRVRRSVSRYSDACDSIDDRGAGDHRAMGPLLVLVRTWPNTHAFRRPVCTMAFYLGCSPFTARRTIEMGRVGPAMARASPVGVSDQLSACKKKHGAARSSSTLQGACFLCRGDFFVRKRYCTVQYSKYSKHSVQCGRPTRQQQHGKKEGKQNKEPSHPSRDGGRGKKSITAHVGGAAARVRTAGSRLRVVRCAWIGCSHGAGVHPHVRHQGACMIARPPTSTGRRRRTPATQTAHARAGSTSTSTSAAHGLGTAAHPAPQRMTRCPRLSSR